MNGLYITRFKKGRKGRPSIMEHYPLDEDEFVLAVGDGGCHLMITKEGNTITIRRNGQPIAVNPVSTNEVRINL